MRALHLVAGNLYGGVERMLVTLARHCDLAPDMLPEFGLCFGGRVRDELSACGVSVHDLGVTRFSRPWSIRAARRAMSRVLVGREVDVVVCHGAWAHAVFAPAVRRSKSVDRAVRLVYFAHDVPTGRTWLERLAARVSPDLVLANSRFTAGFVDSMFPGVRTEVQYPPVEPPPPMDRAAVRREVRRELNCPDDAVVIVCACRMERWKGHTLLLDALQLIRDDPRWRCWIAGGAQRPKERAYLDELKRQTEGLSIASRVHFLGQRDDVPRLLAAADVHCQPNTGPEPFGVAFVEAMYAGLAVVTTDLGGAREVLRLPHAGATLVPPGDARLLSDALAEFIRSHPLQTAAADEGPADAARRTFAPGALIEAFGTRLVALGMSREHEVCHGGGAR